MPDALENLAKLPPRCAAVMDGHAVMIVRGSRQPVKAFLPYTTVGEWNRRHDVTPAQVSAMMAGVTFGWDTEGANPDTHARASGDEEEIGPFNYEFTATVLVPIKVQAHTLGMAEKHARRRAENLADQICFDLGKGVAEIEYPLDLLETDDPR